MQIKESKHIGSLLIIIAALLWAVDGVIRRYLFSLPPVTIIFFEHLFGLIILYPFVRKYILKTELKQKDWILLFIISLFSGLIGTLFFTTALLQVNFISFSVVFLLQKLQPIFAIGSASIFLKEKLYKKYIIWAVLAIISAYFVTFKNGVVDFKTGEGVITAALFALAASFAWGTSTTFSKMLLGKVRSDVSTFYRFLFTVMLSFPLIFVLNKSASLGSITPSQYGLFALIAVSTGMVALLIYYKGLSTTPVHISTILELIFPFVAIFIDMKLYNNTLTISQLIAACVLIFSIYKVVKIRQEQDLEILPV